MIEYVSLHNYTSFSIMQALTKPSELFDRAKEHGQKAIAVTDLGTFAGMWDSLKAANKSKLKFIAGCDYYFVNDVNQKDEPLKRIVLLAKNITGYRNLLLLNKYAYDNFIVLYKKAIPRIDWNLLKNHSEGVICLTGCGNGVLSRLIMQKQFDEVKKQAIHLKEIFGDDLGIEIQAHTLTRKASGYSGAVDQSYININLKKISKELEIRPVVTNFSMYLDKEHHKAHDVLLAIGSGQPITSGARLTYKVPEFYVKSAIDVANYFVRYRSVWDLEFIKQAFENTVYFADKCEHAEWVDPKYSNPSGKELPEFSVADEPDYDEFLKWKSANNLDIDDDKAYLRYKCVSALVEFGLSDKEEYKNRLEQELDVLCDCGVASYMLIVADYVNFAKRNNVPVGPGRGSVGGSLLAYLLGIHEADPIKYGLVFERFYNKLRSDLSDIDLDFSGIKRPLIEKYITNKYGERNVAHVSNFNTITPKVYARDIARTFEFGGDRKEAAKIGNDIADSISADIVSFNKIFEQAPIFYEYAKEYPELADFLILGGKCRNWSTHAAAVIISKRPLDSFVPVRRDTLGTLVLEYEKNRAEDNGLVKMDVLGLSTLDVIEATNKLIKENNKEVPIINYEDQDEKTYELISSGQTLCVFQFGSSAGTMDLCRRTQPKNLEDLALVTTLARPAAKDIRDDFFEVRSGKKEIELIHPKLERAFRNTFGFALFDESLLILAQDVAGWDLNEADRLRKLTKEKGKNPEKAAKWKEDFIKGAKNNGISLDIAEQIWTEIVEPFQKYSFNKSHALLYSMISYHTAYLKAHYPLEFLTANLNFECNSNSPRSKDNVLRIKEEIRSMGIKIVPPDINTSETSYKIIDDKTLMTGLDSLKYMGKDAIPEIITKRPFKSFTEFLAKVDGKKVRAPAIQALAASGCLDSFGLSRKLMFFYASDYKKKLQVHIKKGESIDDFNYPWPDEREWNGRDKYALEENYLGEGISGTVNERFDGFFNKNVVNFSKLPDIFPYEQQSDDEKENRKANTHHLPRKNISILKGVLTFLFSFKVKKEDSPIRGQEMARLSVQDPWGNNISVVVFPDSWQNLQKRIKILSGGKQKPEAGIAIGFTGAFQWENEHTYSFIMGDIVGYKGSPLLPEDLKSRKVKMPRKSKKEKVSNIEDLNQDELMEDLENEMIENGVNSVFDEEDEDNIDPFI